MVKTRRTFRDKKDYINWSYRGSNFGGASSSQLKKLHDEIRKVKIAKNIKGDGTINAGYKIALRNKIIKLRRRKK